MKILSKHMRKRQKTFTTSRKNQKFTSNLNMDFRSAIFFKNVTANNILITYILSSSTKII